MIDDDDETDDPPDGEPPRRCGYCTYSVARVNYRRLNRGRWIKLMACPICQRPTPDRSSPSPSPERKTHEHPHKSHSLL